MAHKLRIQRRRTKGWKMPKGAISVCRPGPFGNPFKTAKEFRDVLEPLLATSGSFNLNCNIEDFGKMSGIAERLPELRGKTLACCR